MLARLTWNLVRLSEKLSALGVLGLMLALITLLYAPVALWPAQQKLQQLPTQVHVTKQQLLPSASSADTFFAQFPTPDTLPAELQSIFDMAQKHGLNLNEVSYKKSVSPNEHLTRLSLDFNVVSDYPSIRAFITDTLVALPYVSLDQLALKRKNVLSNEVQSNIRLTLHGVQP
ncbi:MAG: type 4a pilus biogenesis protein PilO [Methylophilaceae bacterium]|nr:type 4a pilus biogenesis protein PilO [Methylophilaceae bacterium]